MVSNLKRSRYNSDGANSSSSDNENTMEYSNHMVRKMNHKNGKQSIGLSRNALMARENRLRKKMYLNNLENNVKRLEEDNLSYQKLVNTQSQSIRELEKEIKYLKSVLANSADIGHLLRSLQHSTGMSVSTSLDVNTLSLSKTSSVLKSAHPMKKGKCENPSPLSWDDEAVEGALDAVDAFDHALIENGFNDTPLEIPEDFSRTFGFHVTDCDSLGSHSSSEGLMNEHNYTNVKNEALELNEKTDPFIPPGSNNIGVCLHVANHQISLEFCSKCSENAALNSFKSE